MAAARSDAEATDGQQLHRFLVQHDEGAFTTLVRRHGAMVLNVGRRVLQQVQDAEDVFQATFLLLARKASRIRKHDSVGSWLYGTAYRLARKVQEREARRHFHERRAAEQQATAVPLEAAWRGLNEALNDVLQQLPEKHRTVLLLCYWEGQTQEETARQLGCPLGTVRSRLARARDLLHARMARRGLTLSAAAFTAALTESAASAGVPVPLVTATVRVATQQVKEGTATALVSSRVAMLMADGLGTAVTAKVKVVMAIVLLLGGLIGYRLATGGAQPNEHAPATQDQPRSDAPKPKDAGSQPEIDPFPEGARARLGTERLRHGKRIQSIAFTPDGKTLLSGSEDDHTLFGDAEHDRSVIAWDIATGREVRRYTTDRHGRIEAVAVSPDGRLVAGGYYNGSVALQNDNNGVFCVWDAATGKKLLQVLAGREGVGAIAFAHDSKSLFTAERKEDQPIRCWDVTTGQELRQFPGYKVGVDRLAVSPDGKLLASAGTDQEGYTIVFVDLDSGKEVRRYSAHDQWIRGLAFAPDNRMLASVSYDSTVRLWDATTGQRLQELRGHREWVYSVAFAPDGKTLATGGRDRTVRLWDVKSGREQVRIEGFSNSVLTVAFSSDGKTLATGSGAAIQLWDAVTGKAQLSSVGHDAAIRCVAYSPTCKLVASAGDDCSIMLWDAITGRLVRRIAGLSQWVDSLAFSPDGKLLASGSGNEEHTIRIWEIASGKELARWKGDKYTLFLAFSPDGKTLLSGDWLEATIRMRDVFGPDGAVRTESKVRHQFKIHSHRVSSVAFSPDGKLSAAAEEENRPLGGGIDVFPNVIRLWDLTTGKALRPLEGHRGSQVRGMVFSPDGKLLASGGNGFTDKCVRVWDVATGKQIRELEGEADRLAFSPDGRTLATVGAWEPTIHLWEVATGQKRGQFQGHTNKVNDLTFAPDGKTLASVSADTTVLLWDLAGRTKSALTAKDLDALWRDLASGDGSTSYRAVRTLAAASSEALPFLKERLRPVEAERFNRLVADLDSEQFALREQAARELENAFEQVESSLRKTLTAQPSPEARRRTESLLERLPARAERLIEVLELAATPDSRRLIEALAHGSPELRVTGEAKTTLERLRKHEAP
jgi:RNA polymerase sigma factor (sigma-70 family)